MEKKILIVAPYQFGELSDCYYWAKYGKEEARIAYFGYSYKGERASMERTCEGVKQYKVHHYSNRVFLGLWFYIKLISVMLLDGYKHVIICNMPGAKILPIFFPHRNIILDIRTLSVAADMNQRIASDSKLRRTCKSFNKISCISDGIKDKLNLQGKEVAILPLGAENLSNKNKTFEELKLFYIGTFNNRKMDVFIKGVEQFIKETHCHITFDIVGNGTEEETALIKEAVAVCELSPYVKLHGYLTHEESREFFDRCNVGVSFIPMTDYYQYQPPTKTYEYLLSGMVCIATATASNQEVVNKKNGILVLDNESSVCEGLKRLYQSREKYDSAQIVRLSSTYHWEEIIRTKFLPLFTV